MRRPSGVITGCKTVLANDSNQLTDPATAEWAERIPIDQIPGVVLFFSARLLTEQRFNSAGESNLLVRGEAEKILNASELADHLNVPDSWVRSEERMGRIPGIRLGKYARFKLNDVEPFLKNRKTAP